jgi:hypothetical protein
VLGNLDVSALDDDLCGGGGFRCLFLDQHGAV